MCFIKVIGITLILFISVISCKKSDDDGNQPPSCTITNPINGDEISKGTTVTISVEAEDPDGTIQQVLFTIDGQDKWFEPNPPYTFDWNTADESVSSHTIKATATDNNGETGISSITIDLLNSNVSTFIDPRDGNKYYTVNIGSQIWLTENLKYQASSSWCYNGNDNNCNIYGRLYNWSTAMDGSQSSDSEPSGVQGICPPGWHLPSDNEWKNFEKALGMSHQVLDDFYNRGTNQGSKLAGNANLWGDGALKNDPEFGSSGFNALPAGNYSSGSYRYIGNFTQFWSTTQDDNQYAFYRGLAFDKSGIHRAFRNKTDRISVRCVKDY